MDNITRGQIVSQYITASAQERLAIEAKYPSIITASVKASAKAWSS